MKATPSWYLLRQGNFLYFGDKPFTHAEMTKTMYPEQIETWWYRPAHHELCVMGKTAVGTFLLGCLLIAFLVLPEAVKDLPLFVVIVVAVALTHYVRAGIAAWYFKRAQSLIGRGCEDMRNSLIFAQLHRAIARELIAQGVPAHAESIFDAYIRLEFDSKRGYCVAKYFKAAQDNRSEPEELERKALVPARTIIGAVLRDE